MNRHQSFQKYFFVWITPLILLGYQKPLEENDIPWIPVQFSAKRSLDNFLVCWEKEVKVCQESSSNTDATRTILPNARKAMVKSVWREYAGCISAFLPTLAIMIFQPYLVHDILTVLSGTQRHDQLLLGIDNGIALAVLLGVLSLLNGITFCISVFYLSEAGFCMRSAVVAAVFQKSLRLSSRSKSQHTIGELVTMITSDQERIWFSTLGTNWLYGGFILVASSVILLIIDVGISAVVAGIVIAILAIIFQFYVTTKISKSRRDQLKFSSERVKATNEILQVRNSVSYSDFYMIGIFSRVFE